MITGGYAQRVSTVARGSLTSQLRTWWPSWPMRSPRRWQSNPAVRVAPAGVRRARSRTGSSAGRQSLPGCPLRYGRIPPLARGVPAVRNELQARATGSRIPRWCALSTLRSERGQRPSNFVRRPQGAAPSSAQWAAPARSRCPTRSVGKWTARCGTCANDIWSRLRSPDLSHGCGRSCPYNRAVVASAARSIEPGDRAPSTTWWGRPTSSRRSKRRTRRHARARLPV